MTGSTMNIKIKKRVPDEYYCEKCRDRDLCSLKEAGPVRTRPASDASLYNARPLLRDLHHAHTADVHRRIRSVRLCVLLHV